MSKICQEFVKSLLRFPPLLLTSAGVYCRGKKVERSLRTDQEEFYQLLTYTDDVDLNEKLAERDRF
jgi:hypothetical protein